MLLLKQWYISSMIEGNLVTFLAQIVQPRNYSKMICEFYKIAHIFLKIIFGMQNSQPIVPLFKTSRNALRSERERARNDHSLARTTHHCYQACSVTIHEPTTNGNSQSFRRVGRIYLEIGITQNYETFSRSRNFMELSQEVRQAN